MRNKTAKLATEAPMAKRTDIAALAISQQAEGEGLWLLLNQSGRGFKQVRLLCLAAGL